MYEILTVINKQMNTPASHNMSTQKFHFLRGGLNESRNKILNHLLIQLAF